MEVTGSPGARSGRAGCQHGRRLVAIVFWAASFCSALPVAARQTLASVEDLRGLTIEELMSIEVVSALRRPEPVSRTPASVYVITRDDIRRSGALTLPEALRMAPNLTVARRTSREYAISSRGFNWLQLSNKLLVLIDGRSVYTPLHAGVFWDQQQVLLEDVERIEVISGPAGTTWGANAVNGVVNVITRSAHDTQGGLAALAHGTMDSRGALRYGGKVGGRGAWRAYGLGFQNGETVDVDGDGRNDDWDARQGGMRADWRAGADSFTLQGDIFDNPGEAQADVFGGNLQGQWTRSLGEASSFTLLTYYDKVGRDVPGLRDRTETFDIEGRHNLMIGDKHEVVWGAGFRHNKTEFDNRLNFFVLDPIERDVNVANLFVQDSYSWRDDVTVTLGAKVEHNSFTGAEAMPSGRIAWQVSESDMLWAAISRVVRTPSRIDRDLTAAGVLEKAGDNFESENLIAYELGYRGQLGERATLSATLYHHDYDDLRVITTSPSGLIVFGNAQEGYTRGVEAWSDYRVNSRWRLMAGGNLLRKSLDLEDTATSIALVQHQGNDPEYQLFLRSYYNITEDLELDVALRGIGELPSPATAGYLGLDMRLGWHVTDTLELSVVATNLLDSQHPETGLVTERGEIPRAVYAGARWRF